MNKFKPSVYDVQLRPNDFDWSMQLNNSIYVQILEVGRWKWAEKNQLNFIDSKIIAVVSSLNIEYLKPIEWNPVKCIQIKTNLVKMEFYSVSLSQIIEDDGVIVTKAKVRLAMYDSNTKSVLPVKKALI
jgi:acyl-CoA thioesterase FadM